MMILTLLQNWFMQNAECRLSVTPFLELSEITMLAGTAWGERQERKERTLLNLVKTLMWGSAFSAERILGHTVEGTLLLKQQCKSWSRYTEYLILLWRLYPAVRTSGFAGLAEGKYFTRNSLSCQDFTYPCHHQIQPSVPHKHLQVHVLRGERRTWWTWKLWLVRTNQSKVLDQNLHNCFKPLRDSAMTKVTMQWSSDSISCTKCCRHTPWSEQHVNWSSSMIKAHIWR